MLALLFLLLIVFTLVSVLAASIGEGPLGFLNAGRAVSSTDGAPSPAGPERPAVPMPSQSPSGNGLTEPAPTPVATPAPPKTVVFTPAPSDSGTNSVDPKINLFVPPEGIVNVTVAGNGSLSLRPGASSSIDVELTNDESRPVTVTEIGLTVTVRTAQLADATHPCPASDFFGTPGSGFSLVLAPGFSGTLSSLGVPQKSWPQVTMRNTTSNQEGCKYADLTLVYSAKGIA